MIGIGRKYRRASLAAVIPENARRGLRGRKMVSYKRYVAGWLDSSIHDFLGFLPGALKDWKELKFALITCIDSNTQPSGLLGKSPELDSVAGKARPLNSGLLLPTEQLAELNSRMQLFYGFDEIWFFPSDQIKPKPDSASLVGPARIDQVTLGKLGTWMSDNSCSLGLGDGEGLNFVLKAARLARVLLAHSIDQKQSHGTFVASTAQDVAKPHQVAKP
jgi:hypothetical protein